MSAGTGCPDGCLEGIGVDCRAGRPVPDINPHCCTSLGFTELKTARRNGWHCQTGCVAKRLRAAGELL